jgi:hypothetical protein
MLTIKKNQNKVTDLLTPLIITAFFVPFEEGITGRTASTHALHNRPKKNYGKKCPVLRSRTKQRKRSRKKMKLKQVN